MGAYQIKCIKSDNERITHIGGGWQLSEAEAIIRIEDEDNDEEFYVATGNKKVEVIVSTSASGTKYLRTKSDDTEDNNLLSLPECPFVSCLKTKE